MKKIILYSLLQLLLGFSVSAQNFWTETTPYPTHPDYYVKSISIVNENVVWVSGSDNDDAFHTDWSSISLDGGNTWTERPISLGSTNRFVSNIHAISATTAYVSVYSEYGPVQGGIYVTYDSGVTWTKQITALFNTGVDSKPAFVHFFDANNGIAVGNPASGYFEIYTTANAGTNWIRVPAANFFNPSHEDEVIYGAAHYDAQGDTVWFGTNHGSVYSTSDRGFVWQKAQSPLSDFGGTNTTQAGQLAFKNASEGLLYSNLWETYRANDPLYWTAEFNSNQGAIRDSGLVYVPQTPDTYYGWGKEPNGTFGSSYSIDGGLHWVDLQDSDPNSPTPTLAKFFSSDVGYCTAYYNSNPAQKKFFRFTDDFDRFLKNDTFEKTAFSASPNPTDGMVKLSGANITSVTVCDISGKVITTQNYSAVSEANLDLSALQSSIYFAKITTENGASSTIKILKN